MRSRKLTFTQLWLGAVAAFAVLLQPRAGHALVSPRTHAAAATLPRRRRPARATSEDDHDECVIIKFVTGNAM